MSMPDGVDLSVGPQALRVIAFRGPDAARFLQGQLSADIEKLAPGSGTLAGLHNPQGRTVALLALARVGPEEVLAAVPEDLHESVIQRLRRFVLRAKVRIDDASSSSRVVGVAGADPVSAMPGLAWGSRRLQFVPVVEPRPASADMRATWELADVREGLPQVFAATSEQFVAQMLNLDLLGAVAFDKGCYTGQEVIARAHYRGRVKRRLQRWRHSSGVGLRPGDGARALDGRALVTVRAAALPEGGQEVLAVGNFAATEESVEEASPGTVALEGPLPLPYPLPE